MLDRGTALLAHEAVEAALRSGDVPTSERHRRNVLLVAYISALTGLIRAADMSQPSYFREWAKTARKDSGPPVRPGKRLQGLGLGAARLPHSYRIGRRRGSQARDAAGTESELPGDGLSRCGAWSVREMWIIPLAAPLTQNISLVLYP